MPSPHLAPAIGAPPPVKIVGLTELSKLSADLHAKGSRIVLCHGVFDLFHVGHLRHFSAAKKHGDVLIVSITADDYVNKGPDRPVFPAELRAELLAALDIVDWVTVVHHPSAEPAIEAIKPNLYAKGGEYADQERDITGKIVGEQASVERHGGRVIFTDALTFSSSNLLNHHFNLLDKPAQIYLQNVRSSGGERKIADCLRKIEALKILVIGETIIDRYHYVAPMGKSGKENIIATLHKEEETFAGGVIAAANHLASLCPNVEVLTLMGDPQLESDQKAYVRECLQDQIELTTFHRPNGPTTQKTRFVEPTYVRKLFEIYHMDDTPLPEEVQSAFHRTLRGKLEDVDVAIVCDFGHGFINAETVRILEENARFLAINVQTNAGNTGYNVATQYQRADFLCIDATEARLAARDKHADLEKIVAEILPAAVDCPNIIVTHGKTGCYVSGARNQSAIHIPAFRKDVVDTVGAGDAFFVMAAPFIAVGAECQIAGLIGNVAGAIKIGIVGHRSSISRLELQRYVKTLLS